MTIVGGSVGAPSPGLQLLLERLWRQEITHEHVLAELFHHTELARVLGLWERDSRPGVVVEPDRGIFDLALLDEAGTARMYVELKFAAASGWNQRTRQRAFAEAAGAERAYILLGTSFFEIDREPGVRYLGVPELLAGLAATAADGALGELQAAYAERLALGCGGLVGRARPGEREPRRDPPPVPGDRRRLAGRRPPLPGDEPGRPRLDPQRRRVDHAAARRLGAGPLLLGDRRRSRAVQAPVGRAGGRSTACSGHIRAGGPGEAGRDVGIPVERTRRVSGRYMSAAQLPYSVREYVVVDGAVSAERARRLYDEATAVFQAALDARAATSGRLVVATASSEEWRTAAGRAREER